MYFEDLQSPLVYWDHQSVNCVFSRVVDADRELWQMSGCELGMQPLVRVGSVPRTKVDDLAAAVRNLPSRMVNPGVCFGNEHIFGWNDANGAASAHVCGTGVAGSTIGLDEPFVSVATAFHDLP
jgi:hypothetical protein